MAVLLFSSRAATKYDFCFSVPQDSRGVWARGCGSHWSLYSILRWVEKAYYHY